MARPSADAVDNIKKRFKEVLIFHPMDPRPSGREAPLKLVCIYRARDGDVELIMVIMLFR